MDMWIAAGLLMMGMSGSGFARDAEVLELPPPQTTGGMPLMQALQERRSAREFASRPLPPQLLSNLLWAANGVNRPDSGKRTAPTARDWREIDVYVTTAEAAYRYDPASHALIRVVTGDLRRLTGMQDFVETAPVNLVYVADFARTADDDTAERTVRLAAADAAFIAQNVYLFCASAGLATVVRGLVDHAALGKALRLGDRQRVMLAQSAGYPAGAR